MRQRTPLITVIVPVYNMEKYLEKCMESLLKQTYPKIEILLVDDGSQDKSAQMCDDYAASCDRIRVIHKKNEGLGLARNTGMDLATGEYITFLDSDDYIAADLIEKLYDAIEKTGVDVSKAGFERVLDNGKVVAVKSYADEVFEGDRARIEFAPRMIGSRPDAKDSLEMSVCATLYRVGLIRKHNLRFPSEREMLSEDLCFNIDYAQFANGACTISDCGYYYRETAGSLSRKYKPERMARCCDFYQKMKRRLLDFGYGQETVYRLDRMLFINARVCIRQAVQGMDASPARIIREIRAICGACVLQDAIAAHPIRQMNYAQRVFIWLVQKRCGLALYLIAKAGYC